MTRAPPAHNIGPERAGLVVNTEGVGLAGKRVARVSAGTGGQRAGLVSAGSAIRRGCGAARGVRRARERSEALSGGGEGRARAATHQRDRFFSAPPNWKRGGQKVGFPLATPHVNISKGEGAYDYVEFDPPRFFPVRTVRD